MPTTILAFNASLRRAAARPGSALRGCVAALAFFVVATPVSAAFCASSMAPAHPHAMQAVQQDHHALAAHDESNGSGVDCCGTQASPEWTAMPRSPDGDSIDIALHLLPYAGPAAYTLDVRPQVFAPRIAFYEAGLPPPESSLRRSPRLLL